MRTKLVNALLEAYKKKITQEMAPGKPLDYLQFVEIIKEQEEDASEDPNIYQLEKQNLKVKDGRES